MTRHHPAVLQCILAGLLIVALAAGIASTLGRSPMLERGQSILVVPIHEVVQRQPERLAQGHQDVDRNRLASVTGLHAAHLPRGEARPELELGGAPAFFFTGTLDSGCYGAAVPASVVDTHWINPDRNHCRLAGVGGRVCRAEQNG